MANPYLGEIRCFGFNFAPRGWALCNGQILSIAQNTALFSLLGTTYGGNGTSTFALPNLQDQAPMHPGFDSGGLTTVLGESSGAPTATLTSGQLPSHSHGIASAMVAPGGLLEHSAVPDGTVFIGPSNPDNLYNTAPSINAQFQNVAIGATGASVPHDNMQPYLVFSFCIALQGVFPSRN